MGGFLYRCPLGLSTRHTTPLTFAIEEQGAIFERSLERAHTAVFSAFRQFHDASDAAELGDPMLAEQSYRCGRAELTAARRSIDDYRAALARCAEILATARHEAPQDPLFRRDRLFGSLDGDALFHELVTEGAALADQSLWELAWEAMRDHGGAGGLAALAREADGLAAQLGRLDGSLEGLDGIAAADRYHALHDLTRPSTIIAVGLMRVAQLSGHLALLGDAANRLQDRRERGGEELPALVGDALVACLPA